MCKLYFLKLRGNSYKINTVFLNIVKNVIDYSLCTILLKFNSKKNAQN